MNYIKIQAGIDNSISAFFMFVSNIIKLSL